MRIAIVGPGFTGASLPLAQHMYKKGHEVDCYYLTRIGLDSIESLDFGMPLPLNKLEFKIPSTNNIYNYLDRNVNIYIEPIHKLHLRLEKYFLWYIPRWANKIRVFFVVKRLLARKYDRIILIDQFDDGQIGLALARANMKFVTSYHEVLESLTGYPIIRKNVLSSLRLNRPIILHSNKLANDLLHLAGNDSMKSRMSVIWFGPFESFRQYGDGKKVPGIEDGYFLFLGHITVYKGLGLLHETIEKLGDSCKIKIIIAGSGNDPILKTMENDNRYKIINRYIENSEMVWLVKHCRAILCPYVAASQSGLVPLAYAFNKPIIATGVGGFPELIEDGVSGFLAEKATSECFADAIARFVNNESAFTGTPLPDKFNWDIISNKVINLLSKL